MIELGWAAPQTRVDAGTARHAILGQHQKIRVFLAKAQSIADAALDGDAAASGQVASAIGDLRAIFEVHLTFEERVLLPLLDDDLPVGPERANHLREDHRRQRAVMDTLDREARSLPALPTLAAKLVWLVTWLTADMEEEEGSLLTPEVVRDDQIVIDQSSG
jgi:hypothetical protein